jgi:uncharacterized membrane protein
MPITLESAPLLFAIGGAGYVMIELLWRRRSHVSMFLAGGLCLIMLLYLHNGPAPFVMKCVLAGLGITAVEFLFGCVVNLWLKLDVWDYSRRRFNVLGQVCLLYSALWCGLGTAVLAVLRAI